MKHPHPHFKPDLTPTQAWAAIRVERAERLRSIIASGAPDVLVQSFAWSYLRSLHNGSAWRALAALAWWSWRMWWGGALVQLRCLWTDGIGRTWCDEDGLRHARGCAGECDSQRCLDTETP